MKFVVVALSLVAIYSVSAVTDEDRQRAMQFMQDCANELGITSEDLLKYREDIKSSEDEPKAQNYAKCFFQKIGYFDQNGDVQESRVITNLSTGEKPLITEDKAKQCIANAGDNKANTFSLNLYACIKQNMRV